MPNQETLKQRHPAAPRPWNSTVNLADPALRLPLAPKLYARDAMHKIDTHSPAYAKRRAAEKRTAAAR